uniref:Uncharacterized protein n=1 Tax=Cacopsylla melanoneura TaxID=428564 RepID=A0A8D8Y4V2_9HEMI
MSQIYIISFFYLNSPCLFVLCPVIINFLFLYIFFFFCILSRIFLYSLLLLFISLFLLCFLFALVFVSTFLNYCPLLCLSNPIRFFPLSFSCCEVKMSREAKIYFHSIFQ